MKQLASVFALIALFAHLTTAQASYPIEGNWGIVQQDNGFTLDMTFTIVNSTITLKNVCSYRGLSATARVTSPASYNEATISILSNDTDSASNGGLDCNANLQVGTMNYKVVGNSLIFTQDGSSDQFVLTRR